MANHRGVKLCKAKGQYTENRMVNVPMSWTVFTDLYTQSRTFGFFSSSSSRRIAVAVTQIVFNCSTWSFIMASRARQATIESSSLLFITDLNTALLVERSLTTVISYISSASVCSNVDKICKIDQSEGIPDPGTPERPFVKFSHRRSLASSPLAFFIFSRTVFCTAPGLTEHLEEASSRCFHYFPAAMLVSYGGSTNMAAP